MRKHELVHLHALVRTVADHLIGVDALDAEVLADYEALGVTPVSLQASRDDHRVALLSIAAAVADNVAAERPVRHEPPSDRDVTASEERAGRPDGPVL